MHGKQVNFTILIFIIQSCMKGVKYIATAPRESPAAPQSRECEEAGRALQWATGLLTREAIHLC